MNVNRLAAHAASAVLALITMHASAQTAATGYRKLEVGGRVTLEVPLDWKVSDADWREKVAKDGARILGQEDAHVVIR